MNPSALWTETSTRRIRPVRSAKLPSTVQPTAPAAPPVAAAGQLPALSDEIARAFLQDVQSPWQALFEVTCPPGPSKPVILAREVPDHAASLPV